MAHPASTRWLRTLGGAARWWLAGAALSLAAGAVGAAAAALLLTASGFELGEVQRELWWKLAVTIAGQALAPLGAVTVAAWGLLCTMRPGLDRSWRSLAPGVAGVAVLAFPPIGTLCFTAWTPGSPWDYLGTWVGVAGGVAAALLLPRRWVARLGPGALFPG